MNSFLKKYRSVLMRVALLLFAILFAVATSSCTGLWA